MRKKFTMLLATFLVCLGGVKAQVKVISEIRENITDISELEDNSYVIFKNVGRNGYVYEQSADKLMKLGTEAIVGRGAEYIWQVHKENDEKYSFSSATGNYISTPLDGGNVLTVASDNKDKDNFIITKHNENPENWKLQSSNDPNIYWDGQGADGSHRFVGWQGKGNNSQYQIIPVSVQEHYSLTVFYQRGEQTVHTETAAVEANSIFKVTAPIFTTITSCSIGDENIQGDENGIYSCSISKHNTEIMVQISETSLDLTETYRLKNVLSSLFMTIVGTGQAGEIQIKNLSEDAAQKFTFEETQTKNGYKIKSENDTENSYYLTAVGAWDYSATTEGGSIHIIEEVGEGVYRLKSTNGYIASNQDATADGSPMYSNHPQDRNTNTWEFVSTEKKPDELLQEEIAILKREAEDILEDFSSINIETIPFTETIGILTNAINKASENGQATDLNTLNEIKANLNTAINLSNKTTFHSGILASLEADEYIVYYEDNSGNKHYLKNEENRVKSSALPTVYDVTNGVTEGGYVEYAYHFNMNNTNISNPTNNDAKEIQTDSRTTPRVWESQVLYVNSQGKYAIRSTNCPAGSGWNSDAFITISEDGTTVSGQNTDLSDALYIWNIEKVNAEASINNVKYETLTAAIAAADPGATVTLIDDITSSEIIEISKSITLDLGGHTVTGTGNRLFRITAAKSIVTIKNGTIENGVKEGRCVETRAGGINLTLEDLTLTATGNASQPFTVGGNSGENGNVIVNMTRTTVNAGTNNGYAITTFNPVVMTINHSTVSGWAALNIKEANNSVGSVGSEFSIVNESQLIGVNNAAAAASNNFSTIMIEDSDITFTIDGNSSVARAESNNSNAQFIFAIGNENVNNEITGLNILVSQGATLKGTILGINGKQSFAAIETMKVPEEYAGKLQEEGYAVGEPIENLVQVIGVAVAKVNGVCYATVTDAINAAENGGTVQLLPGTISEFIAPWTGDSQHKSEKSITIVGAKDEEGNLATTLTGGLFLGYNDGTVRENTITVKELSFEGKGMVVANQKYVVIEGNKFTNIESKLSDSHGNSDCAILVLGTSKDMCIEVSIKNNEINTVTNNAGIYLSQVNSVVVEGNTVIDTKHNSLTVSASATATIEVKDNTFADWAQNEDPTLYGRAVRSSGGNTVKITENVMTYDGEAPEEFVKVSGTTSLDVSANYWNGVSPTTEGIFLFDKYTGDIVPIIDTYYTNVEKTELVAVGYAELTLIDKEEYTNNRDREVGTLNYKRTFGHGSWQVLFVPFDIPLANMGAFDVYEIEKMSDDNKAIIVKEVTQNSEGDKVLEAHNPYFIKVKDWTASVEKTITVENATLTVPQAYEETYGNYTLYGTYAPKAITENHEYVLTGGEWCQLDNSDQVLGAFRAYLTANVNGAPALRIVTRGETDIETLDAQPATEAIYDLTGRKVETMDKGIYIVNGRKVVIK